MLELLVTVLMIAGGFAICSVVSNHDPEKVWAEPQDWDNYELTRQDRIDIAKAERHALDQFIAAEEALQTKEVQKQDAPIRIQGTCQGLPHDLSPNTGVEYPEKLPF
jgi:hypothetical protein